MAVTVPRELLRQVVRLQAVALRAVRHGDDPDRPRAVRLKAAAKRVTVHLSTNTCGVHSDPWDGLPPYAPCKVYQRQVCAVLQHPPPSGYGARKAYPVEAFVVGGLVVDRDLFALRGRERSLSAWPVCALGDSRGDGLTATRAVLNARVVSCGVLCSRLCIMRRIPSTTLLRVACLPQIRLC